MDPPKHFDPKIGEEHPPGFHIERNTDAFLQVACKNFVILAILGGDVYSARLDGSQKKVILSGQRSLTGIALLDVK